MVKSITLKEGKNLSLKVKWILASIAGGRGVQKRRHQTSLMEKIRIWGMWKLVRVRIEARVEAPARKGYG